MKLDIDVTFEVFPATPEDIPYFTPFLNNFTLKNFLKIEILENEINDGYQGDSYRYGRYAGDRKRD